MIVDEQRRLQAEVDTLRYLLSVHEETALLQLNRAESALRELRTASTSRDAEAQLIHQLIEVTREGVLVLDREWNIRYMNGNATRPPVGRGGPDRQHAVRTLSEYQDDYFLPPISESHAGTRRVSF